MASDKKEKVKEAVIESLKRDFLLGDYTVLDELLNFVPTKNLIQSLSEEEWGKFNFSVKVTIPIALNWWSSLKPKETERIIKKHFVESVSTLHLSNQQIKRIYEKEVLKKK